MVVVVLMVVVLKSGNDVRSGLSRRRFMGRSGLFDR